LIACGFVMSANGNDTYYCSYVSISNHTFNFYRSSQHALIVFNTDTILGWTRGKTYSNYLRPSNLVQRQDV